MTHFSIFFAYFASKCKILLHKYAKNPWISWKIRRRCTNLVNFSFFSLKKNLLTFSRPEFASLSFCYFGLFSNCFFQGVSSFAEFQMAKNSKICQILHFLTTSLLKKLLCLHSCWEWRVSCRAKKNWEDFSSKRSCKILTIQKNLEIHRISPVLCIKFIQFSKLSMKRLYFGDVSLGKSAEMTRTRGNYFLCLSSSCRISVQTLKIHPKGGLLK